MDVEGRVYRGRLRRHRHSQAGARQRLAYRIVSAMGLVWSMTSTGANVHAYRPPLKSGVQTINFHLMQNGKPVATAQLEQAFLPDGVHEVKLTGALHGFLFLPDAPGPHPGVLVVGGSEGGLPAPKAIWLAGHGYAALALAYFHYENLPQDLQAIPLEYFGEALSWMKQRPEINPDQLAVMGTSRGGELALQLGSMYPAIKAVVAYVPANVRYPACCGRMMPAAWTWKGLRFSHIARDERSRPLRLKRTRRRRRPSRWSRPTASISVVLSGGRRRRLVLQHHVGRGRCIA